MKQIQLTQGKVALVDDEDFDYLNQWKWHATKCKTTYYARSVVNGNLVLMHRLILKPERHLVIDHTNHEGLDNRKTNIRICSRAQNNSNKRASGNCKYLGVTFSRDRHKYVAQITHNKRTISLGRYGTAMEAAIAYNKAASEYHGDFANLNDIQ